MSTKIAEDIEELKQRIGLLDGDKKAYSESSQWAIKQNKELISQLRAENKLIRAQLSKKMKADDDVIAEVFQAHKCRTPADLRGLSGEAAVRRYDQTVCEMIKKHNALQHVKRSREQMLANLETQVAQMELEEELTNSTPSSDSEDSKMLRQLENRLDKAVIKNSEAAHIRKTYETIIQKLQEERLGFDNEIEDLEKGIKLRKSDLNEFESMCKDAQLARDMAKMELSHQEQSMGQSRRERDKVLAEYKKQVNEKKDFAEKVEKRLNRRGSGAFSAGHLGTQANTVQEVQEAKISSYEEALAKIKDATGVSDIQEVVDRFLNQGDTKRHLEYLKEENIKVVERLKEEKQKLNAQFEELKYSGEAKMSTGQRMLEEFKAHLDDAKKKCSESEMKAKAATKLLGQVKNGVEHLTEKMQHIKAPHSHVLKPKLDVDSEEYVIEQLSQVEQKLVNIAEELSSRDLETIHKEMEDEEFRHIVEGGVSGNIKVEISKIGSDQIYYDEDSDSDVEFVNRDTMKRTTTALVESKTKTKPQDDDEADVKKKRKGR